MMLTELLLQCHSNNNKDESPFSGQYLNVGVPCPNAWTALPRLCGELNKHCRAGHYELNASDSRLIELSELVDAHPEPPAVTARIYFYNIAELLTLEDPVEVVLLTDTLSRWDAGLLKRLAPTQVFYSDHRLAILFDPELFPELVGEILTRCSPVALGVLARVNRQWSSRTASYRKALLMRGITLHNKACYIGWTGNYTEGSVSRFLAFGDKGIVFRIRTLFPMLSFHSLYDDELVFCQSSVSDPFSERVRSVRHLLGSCCKISAPEAARVLLGTGLEANGVEPEHEAYIRTRINRCHVGRMCPWRLSSDMSICLLDNAAEFIDEVFRVCSWLEYCWDHASLSVQF